MRLLGAVRQVGHDWIDEWNTTRAKCWAAFAAEPFPSSSLHKVRKLQIAVSGGTWPRWQLGGDEEATSPELQSANPYDRSPRP